MITSAKRFPAVQFSFTQAMTSQAVKVTNPRLPSTYKNKSKPNGAIDFSSIAT